jgi:secreted trypsin-like serine protease
MGSAGRLSAVVAAAALVILAAVPATSGAAQTRGDSSGGTRIVGGSTTTIEEWPWQVAIALHPSEGGDGFDRQFCGGSLVAANIVITAAHCVYDNPNLSGQDANDDDFDNPANYSVITGRTTLSSSAGQEIAVANTYYPVAGGVATPDSPGQPLYNPDTSEWDAVFLQLSSNSTSGTIKLAGPDERALWEAGDPAVATGWGTTVSPDPGGFSRSDTLREVDIHIISDSDCGSPLVYDGDFYPETMVCAGELSGGKDTCAGDSGGPLVVPNPAGGFRLVGDTSWGIGCGLPNNPGVYGRIADDPMRSALRNGILAVAGVDVVGSRDTDPPQTEITKHPRKRIRSAKRKVRVKFKFNSDEAGSTFECRLDKRRLKSCSSPRKYRVGTPDQPRKHVFKVFATDPSGNRDPTPAKFRFKVSD